MAMNTETIKPLLDAGCAVRLCEPLAPYTTFRVGGPADALVLPAGAEQLALAVRVAAETETPFFVMGGGSNLLVGDGGVRGMVILVGDGMSAADFDGTRLMAQAGARLSALARRGVERGLRGLHFAGGIPGSLGGAVYMNAGAYGGEVADCFVYATCLDPRTGETVRVEKERALFGYRASFFQKSELIVLDAAFDLERDGGGGAAAFAEWNRQRRQKQPSLPSAGSIFKRPDGAFAGALIEQAGCKGMRAGGAQVSELHAGFIVNVGGATAADVRALVTAVKRRVSERFGVLLQEEIRMIGEDA